MTAQFFKYSLVGAANTAITMSTYLVLIALGTPYLAASALGYLLGAANSYALNYRFTFDARGIAHRHTLARFAVVQGFGIASNLGLIYVLVHAGVGKAPAQGAVTLIVLALTFAMNRLWAFARPAASPVTA